MNCNGNNYFIFLTSNLICLFDRLYRLLQYLSMKNLNTFFQAQIHNRRKYTHQTTGVERKNTNQAGGKITAVPGTTDKQNKMNCHTIKRIIHRVSVTNTSSTTTAALYRDHIINSGIVDICFLWPPLWQNSYSGGAGGVATTIS